MMELYFLEMNLAAKRIHERLFFKKIKEIRNLFKSNKRPSHSKQKNKQPVDTSFLLDQCPSSLIKFL